MNNGGIRDEATVATLRPSSPTSKVKFLCSHGGKILPRPTDNQMKYVGGETRIVAVPRDVTYTELMKKLVILFEGNVVLKYQLTSEDLEALVSVRSDEDLKYMFEEYRRLERGGISKLRTFLFPDSPVVVDSQTTSSVDSHALEQRYIDAINGIVRTNNNAKMSALSPTKRPVFTISSACSSPKSVCGDQHDVMSQDTLSVHSYQTARGMNRMHKVHSSPNLYNLNSPSGPYPGANLVNLQHHHGHNLNHRARSPSLPPPPNLQSYHPPSPNPHKVVGMEKPMLALPVAHVDVTGRNSFSGYPTNRYYRGNGPHYDDSGI